jgi:hypothetical protein
VLASALVLALVVSGCGVVAKLAAKVFVAAYRVPSESRRQPLSCVNTPTTTYRQVPHVSGRS